VGCGVMVESARGFFSRYILCATENLMLNLEGKGLQKQTKSMFLTQYNVTVSAVKQQPGMTFEIHRQHISHHRTMF
jgi:hypothetical protein